MIFQKSQMIVLSKQRNHKQCRLVKRPIGTYDFSKSTKKHIWSEYEC